MRRLRLLLLLFVLGLTLPLGYLVVRTYQGLEHEESAKMHFFGETLFDAMQEELTDLIRREESRSVDAYNTLQDQVPAQPYVLAYVQAAPEDLGAGQSVLLVSKDKGGSYVTRKPAAPKTRKKAKPKTTRQDLGLEWLDEEQVGAKSKAAEEDRKKKELAAAASRFSIVDDLFAGKYFSVRRKERQQDYLVSQNPRVEQLTAEQAKKLAPKDKKAEKQKPVKKAAPKARIRKPAGTGSSDTAGTVREVDLSPEVARPELGLEPETFAVEVNPLQAVFLKNGNIFIFRRIVIDHRILRQGLVLDVRDFLEHLARTYFLNQPLSIYSRMTLWVRGSGQPDSLLEAGADIKSPQFTLVRNFPRPFDFLEVGLECGTPPVSDAMRTVHFLVAALLGVLLLGVFAIYKSTRVVVEHSERRSGFVSSVTHELKTPLTNIRLYIEMLEQGIARDRNREQDYFRILRTESERLGRLINNVLEFSKLEKRNRSFTMSEGDLSEVVAEVRDLMSEKMRKEGFSCTIRFEPDIEAGIEADFENENPAPDAPGTLDALDSDAVQLPVVRYDREAMIQVLLNLMENSVKFGKEAEKKEITVTVSSDAQGISLRVSDSGPGIPKKALAKVFEDFYRVDNSLTRKTKGTGIGLALVKKLVQEMGGKVHAENNPEGGCSVIIRLPAVHPE